jgi:hypothetical protein
MSDYVKQATLLLRIMGLAMFLYAASTILWRVLASPPGPTATDGSADLRSVVLIRGVFAIVGLLLLVLARPLARVAAYKFEKSDLLPPAV